MSTEPLQSDQSPSSDTPSAENSLPAIPSSNPDRVAGDASSDAVATDAIDYKSSAETSAAEHHAPIVDSQDDSAVESAADSVLISASVPAPRRRVQLNPTVDTNLAKPVPTYGTGKSTAPAASKPSSPDVSINAADVDQTPAIEDADLESSSQSESEPPSGDTQIDGIDAEEERPVASVTSTDPIPIPEVDELGADLEAEIAAALGGDDRTAEVAVAQSEAIEEAQLEEDSLEKGARLKGKVQTIHADNVFLELGYRSPGTVSLRQFESGKHPAVGDEIEVLVDRLDPAEGLILVNLPRGKSKIAGNWDALSVGMVVDCLVSKTNKGGLEVTVGTLRGFLPAGQIDLGYVSDLEPYVGEKLRVQVAEVNPRKRNLVVSRRAYLLLERAEAEEELWKTLAEGQEHTGIVKTLKDYGAFVDIGGVDGFLHIGEISWARIKHPSEVIQQGQEVAVKVLSLDPEKKKISLGMRQLVPNPWSLATINYPTGSTVSGKVTRTADFGAFVELEPGLEGLIHISELDHKHVKRVADIVREGQQIDVKILDVDPEKRRIGLSLKALQEAPEIADESPESHESAPVPKKRKGTLKGGTGEKSGAGGLFGNPTDFK